MLVRLADGAPSAANSLLIPSDLGGSLRVRGTAAGLLQTAMVHSLLGLHRQRPEVETVPKLRC